MYSAKKPMPDQYDSIVASVLENGAAVLPAAFKQDDIAWARDLVLDQQDLMANTRNTPSSRHLAGFHRYPQLEPLHTLITGNEDVQGLMAALCGERHRTIGLSDITVNRSQQWHKDLLRGEFAHHLGAGAHCAEGHSTLFKVILYLQDSSSLKIIPGSHRTDIDLSSDDPAIPEDESGVTALPVERGDAVIIDICTTHRGSWEQDFDSPMAIRAPKILISTVFGRHDGPLTSRMEQGNAARLASWTARHLTD